MISFDIDLARRRLNRYREEARLEAEEIQYEKDCLREEQLEREEKDDERTS
jgi:hypothetical protein